MSSATEPSIPGGPGGMMPDAAMVGVGFAHLGESMQTTCILSAVMIAWFLLFSWEMPETYRPKTFPGMVPERQRFASVFPSFFRFSDRGLIDKCGLDNYLVLRYVVVILQLFSPMWLINTPVLIPLYLIEGKGWNVEANSDSLTPYPNGLWTLDINNIRDPKRYWCSLVIAILNYAWFCYVARRELKFHKKIRYEFLTSPENRLRPSVSTLLIGGLATEQRNVRALEKLFHGFKIKHITINRYCKPLSAKIAHRDAVHFRLEQAETALIKRCWGVKMRKDTVNLTRSESEEYASRADAEAIRRYLHHGIQRPDGRDPNFEVSGNQGLEFCDKFWKENDKSGGAPFPAWKWWIKRYQRPHHRDPKFSWLHGWFTGMPGFGIEKDTIFWCRTELARLNFEIRQEQADPEAYTPINSAFIQFEDPATAHMAARTRRVRASQVEIAPANVVWVNLGLEKWQQWGRSIATDALVGLGIVIWSVFFAWSQRTDFFWGGHRPAHVPAWFPAFGIQVVNMWVPRILSWLARLAGATSKVEQQHRVQWRYLLFLFVNAFLVASFGDMALRDLVVLYHQPSLVANHFSAQAPNWVAFFMAYLWLQGMSMSSTTLAQLSTMFIQIFVGPIIDRTPRLEHKRRFTLSSIAFGPTLANYTSFACIVLIFSVSSPLILSFGLVVFGVLYLSQRYNLMYVIKTQNDTGGRLYPTAIHQLFIGIYLQQGLLVCEFIATNSHAQLSVMVCVFVLTLAYHCYLQHTFRPLQEFTCNALEDNTVARDCERQHAEQGPHPYVFRDFLGPGVKEVWLEELTEEHRNQSSKQAYEHPAFRNRAPIVWIPHDVMGVSENEKWRTWQYTGHIGIIDGWAMLNSDNRVQVSGHPPGRRVEDNIEL